MGLLWGLFKEATSPVTDAVQLPPPPDPVIPPFESSWTPEVGWKSPDNPGGWVRPRKESQRKELFLWDQWKKHDEHPVVSAPLVQALRPIIYKQGVQGWAKRVPIAQPVLEQKALHIALEGLSSYDPTRGQINTHLTHRFKNMFRFVKSRQNVTRITEPRLELIGPVDRAVHRLKDKLEREPTLMEIAEEAKIPVESVAKLFQERKQDELSSMDPEPFIEETPQDRLILQLIRYSLTPDEEIVLNYFTGQGGKPLISSPGEIARREGWAGSKVSHIKAKLQAKIKAAR